MTSDLKSIRIYDDGGINPTKVIFILEIRGLPYQQEKVLLADIKKPQYTEINPNGRLPSMQDPNTNITLWEYGAIVEYLIETHDKENKLNFAAGSLEHFEANQWLHFQMSGQGPHFG